MHYCKLYINISILPVIFSPAEYYSENGEYRKIPQYFQHITFFNSQKYFEQKKCNHLKADTPVRKKTCKINRRQYPLKQYNLASDVENNQVKKFRKRNNIKISRNLGSSLPASSDNLLGKESDIPLISASEIALEKSDSGDKQRLNKEESQRTEIKNAQKIPIKQPTTSHSIIDEEETQIMKKAHKKKEIKSSSDLKSVYPKNDSEITLATSVKEKGRDEQQLVKNQSTEIKSAQQTPIEWTTTLYSISNQEEIIPDKEETQIMKKVQKEKEIKSNYDLESICSNSDSEVTLAANAKEKGKDEQQLKKEKMQSIEMKNAQQTQIERNPTLDLISDQSLNTENNSSNVYHHLSIRKALILGDRITVYNKEDKIDTGRFIYLGMNFFLWTDREGHIRIQLIEGPVTIKKH